MSGDWNSSEGSKETLSTGEGTPRPLQSWCVADHPLTLSEAYEAHRRRVEAVEPPPAIDSRLTVP
jgi:hypothetical protein